MDDLKSSFMANIYDNMLERQRRKLKLPAPSRSLKVDGEGKFDKLNRLMNKVSIGEKVP